ncbi:MAG: hypothetical protein RR620_14635 [Clostridium sp.]
MFKSILINEFKRNFSSLKFLVAFIGFIAVFFIVFNRIEADTGRSYSYDVYERFISIMAYPVYSFMPMVLPIIACLIAGSSLYQDINSNYINFLLTRVDSKKYIRSKSISIAIVTFVGLILFQLVGFLCLLVFRKGSTSLIKCEPFELLVGVFDSYPLSCMFIIMGLIALGGASTVMISLMLSIKVKNQYLVIAGPWLMYEAIQCLKSLLMEFFMVVSFEYSPIKMLGFFIYQQKGIILVPIMYWGIILTICYILTVCGFKFRYVKG